ncbi:nuclear transport factor 2 family protein [Ruegeria faecimaris]|uniref:SnoaL-like domain-containing protein n=1 Tax=Ruegeria faecimaris TaxID=686389 RepID=A0A521ENC4_9RHOB|nr:nuclear transport factor 2 family protein [Ruegeria faecimaris]SMO84630.1 SnoaL-like domain-containing protein [Ruegeria faecimaris]
MTALTRDLVDSVGDAFNANDIDSVMRHFATDATFDHAVGPEEHGVRLEGAETIRGAFAALFEKVANVHWETLDCAISGNKAYCEYRRTAVHKDGSKEEFLSVDILTYRDGLIVHKDTYYKQRTS